MHGLCRRPRVEYSAAQTFNESEVQQMHCLRESVPHDVKVWYVEQQALAHDSINLPCLPSINDVGPFQCFLMGPQRLEAMATKEYSLG